MAAENEATCGCKCFDCDDITLKVQRCVGSFDMSPREGPLTQGTHKILELVETTLEGFTEDLMVTVWCARLTGKLWAKYALPLSQLFIVAIEFIVLTISCILKDLTGDELADDVFIAWLVAYLFVAGLYIPMVVKTTHMEHHMVEIFEADNFQVASLIDEKDLKTTKEDTEKDLENEQKDPKMFSRLFLDYGLQNVRASANYRRKKQKHWLTKWFLLDWHTFEASTLIHTNKEQQPGLFDCFVPCEERQDHRIKKYAKMIYIGRKAGTDKKELIKSIQRIIINYNEGDRYNALKRHCQVFARDIWFLFKERTRVISGKECVFRDKYLIYIIIRLLMPVYFILGFAVGFTSRVSLACLATNVVSFSTRFVGYCTRNYVEELAAGEYWACNILKLVQSVKPKLDVNGNSQYEYEEQILGHPIPKVVFYFFMAIVMYGWNMLYVFPLLFGLLVVESISDYSLEDNWGSSENLAYTLTGVAASILLFIVGTKIDEKCFRPNDKNVHLPTNKDSQIPDEENENQAPASAELSMKEKSRIPQGVDETQAPGSAELSVTEISRISQE